MKKTFTIPNDLVYELERLARFQDTTQSSIIIQAMALYFYFQKHDTIYIKNIDRPQEKD